MPQSWDKKPVSFKLDSKHAVFLIITLRELRDEWENAPKWLSPNIGDAIQKRLRLCKETLADLEAAIEEM